VILNFVLHLRVEKRLEVSLWIEYWMYLGTWTLLIYSTA
jgi:hypothetical protein